MTNTPIELDSSGSGLPQFDLLTLYSGWKTPSLLTGELGVVMVLSVHKSAGATMVAAFHLAQERMALERRIPTKLSALKDRLIAAFDKSLYLSSHSLEIAYKTCGNRIKACMH